MKMNITEQFLVRLLNTYSVATGVNYKGEQLEFVLLTL